MTTAFNAWREALRKTQSLEIALAIAQNPATPVNPVEVARLTAELAQARKDVDAALAACLDETQREKRSVRRLGIDSGGNTVN